MFGGLSVSQAYTPTITLFTISMIGLVLLPQLLGEYRELGFLRRLHHLSPRTARRFVLAGALYVGGAVLFELPLGWWTARHGDDGLGYYLIVWCEETLELAGLTLFAGALLERLAGVAGDRRVVADLEVVQVLGDDRQHQRL